MKKGKSIDFPFLFVPDSIYFMATALPAATTSTH